MLVVLGGTRRGWRKVSWPSRLACVLPRCSPFAAAQKSLSGHLDPYFCHHCAYCIAFDHLFNGTYLYSAYCAKMPFWCVTIYLLPSDETAARFGLFSGRKRFVPVSAGPLGSPPFILPLPPLRPPSLPRSFFFALCLLSVPALACHPGWVYWGWGVWLMPNGYLHFCPWMEDVAPLDVPYYGPVRIRGDRS